MTVAENDVKRSEGHCSLQAQRREIALDLDQLRDVLQSTEDECLYLEGDLSELQKRNEEIEEQIESRR